MATKRKIPLNRINGVSSNGTATIDLPTDVRYHEIHFEYNTATAGGPLEAIIEAELPEFRLNIDGVTQRAVSSAQQFDINRTKGISPTVGANNGYIPFFLSEPQRATQTAREATAWGMKDVGRFQIEVDIAVGAASPVLSGWAIVDDVQEAPNGIVKMKKEIIQVAATGELIYKLDTDKGDSYQGLYLFEGVAGDINRMKLEWDGVKMQDIDENVYTQLMSASDFTEVSGLRYISLDDNNPGDALPSFKTVNGQNQKVREFLATLTMGGANNVTLIREMVGSPD